MFYNNKEITKRKNVEIKIKNTLNIAMYIILIILISYNILIIAQSILFPNKTPSFFGVKTYVIISGSMEPEINIGDIVVVKEEKNNLKVEDIISYRKGQSVITHRISQIVENDNDRVTYKTKGDNNNTEDSEKIESKEIEGKVIKVIPKLGKLSLMLKNKVIIIFVLIILYICILKSYKKNKKIKLRHLKRLEYEKLKNN